MALALFLILQSCKSGFDSPVIENRLSETEAKSTELVLESTRAAEEAMFKSELSSTSPVIDISKGNSEVLKDLEGSINQRNYPMVGKDQADLYIPSEAPLLDIDGANAVPMNVNSLPYPIEGYDEGSPFMETPEEWFQKNTEKLLDVTAPDTAIPTVPTISPTQGNTLEGGNLTGRFTSILNNNISGRSGK